MPHGALHMLHLEQQHCISFCPYYMKLSGWIMLKNFSESGGCLLWWWRGLFFLYFTVLLKTGSRVHDVNNFEGTFIQSAINSSGLNQSAAALPRSAGGQTSIHGAVPVSQTVIQQCEAPRLSCAINKNAIEPLRMLHHPKVSGTHHCIGNMSLPSFPCESLHWLHVI